MTNNTLRTLLTGAGLSLAIALGVAAPVTYQVETGAFGLNSAEARRGADDGPNHDVGDDRGRGRGRGSDDASTGTSNRRGRR